MSDRGMQATIDAPVSPIVSLAARVAIVLVLVTVAVVVSASRWVRAMLGLRDADVATASRHVILVGTFYNTGWLRSHVTPMIATDSIRQVIIVTDSPQTSFDRTRYVCPPRWLQRCLTRSGARLVAAVQAGRSCNGGALLIGYHIMPNALIALVAARVLGLPAVYQMTGGPVQLAGGGVGSENRLLRLQRKPSALRERLIMHLVGQFDMVICRGSRSAEFLRQRGVSRNVSIIPGAVETQRYCLNGQPRIYDLISVGRLVPVKRYDRLLQILIELARRQASVRAAIVGDGPQRQWLQGEARRLGISDNIDFLGQCDDVPALLARSKTFAITSASEGMSIAMLEAMAAGVPVIVPDVGDLRDIVTDGQTGVIIDPTVADDAADRIASILNDTQRLHTLSTNARQAAAAFADVQAVAAKWDAALSALGGARI